MCGLLIPNRHYIMLIAALVTASMGPLAYAVFHAAAIPINRLLIWNCMLHYRNAGLEIFDLGGWYNGTTDTARLGINKFKEGFGGKVVREFEGECLRTMKARAALLTARLLTKWRHRRRRDELAATLNAA